MSQDRTLYYTAPSDEIFNDMKQACISVWKTYDDTYGYASQKVNQIKDITNVRDNFMYMIAMFDAPNRCRVLELVSEATHAAFQSRMPTTCGLCQCPGAPFPEPNTDICPACVENLPF